MRFKIANFGHSCKICSFNKQLAILDFLSSRLGQAISQQISPYIFCLIFSYLNFFYFLALCKIIIVQWKQCFIFGHFFIESIQASNASSIFIKYTRYVCILCPCPFSFSFCVCPKSIARMHL